MPDLITIRSTTLKLLKEFAEAGGKVIIAGKCPEYVDARPSDAAKALAGVSENIHFDRIDILNSLEKFRTIDIRYENGLRTENFLYQMRHEEDRDWLFVAHAFKVDPVDVPHREKLGITIDGEYKPVLYDALSGDICEIPYEIRNGKTFIKREVYDQDSLLFGLDPIKNKNGQLDPQDSRTGQDNPQDGRNGQLNPQDGRTGVNGVAERKMDPIALDVPAEAGFRLSEDNVLLLDMAEYSLDGGEFEPLEDILRLDNRLRKRFGYPLRMHAQAQPWVTGETDYGKAHRICLRYRFESQIEGTETGLGLEDAEDCEIIFNGEAVDSTTVGTYVDMSIDRIKLGKLKKGINTLLISMSYDAVRNLEAVYVLGDFGVRLKGSRAVITQRPEKIGFGDISTQDLAFYSGNIGYTFDIDVPDDGNIIISATCFRCPAIAVEIDGERAGLIAFSPYEACIGNVGKGRHTVTLTAFGNRMNTFGPLHLCDYRWNSQSPDAWRTEGARWSYEYRTAPTGILKRPEILYLSAK